MTPESSKSIGLRTAGLREYTVLCSDEERRIVAAVAIGEKMRRNEI